MSAGRLFGVLVAAVLILIVLVVVWGNISKLDLPGKSDEVKKQAEEMARLMEVANNMCPEDRMSGFQESVLATGEKNTYTFRELEGDLQCDIKGTDEGECIIVGLYRKDWCADEGLTCPSGWGKNIGTYQFTVDTGGESVMDFSPLCIGTTDTTGCCIIPTKGEGTDGLLGCEWWIYEWTYYGEGKSLNLLLPNGQTANIWSRFADKQEGDDTDEHTCTWGNDLVKFHTQSYAYDQGELKVKYTKCCPEGWTWNGVHEVCCIDDSCTNYLCKYPAFFFYGTCWMVSELGESCEEACMRTGKTCSPESLQASISNGLGNDCVLQSEAGYTCAGCSGAAGTQNSLAPFFDPPGGCFYYDAAEAAANPFDCGLSDAGLNRICPCKLTGEKGICEHLVHEPGTCMDEDGGQVWDVAACVINDFYSWRDQCEDPATGANVHTSNLLREHYCNPDGTIGTQYHTCSCEDGACIA